MSWYLKNLGGSYGKDGKEYFEGKKIMCGGSVEVIGLVWREGKLDFG